MNNFEFNDIINKLTNFLKTNKDADKEVWTCQSIKELSTINQVYSLFSKEQVLSTEEASERNLFFTFILLDNNTLLEFVETGKINSVSSKQLFFGLIPNANLLTIETNNGKVRILNEKGLSLHEGFDEILVNPKELPEKSYFMDVVKPTSIDQIIDRVETKTRIRTNNTHQKV